MLYIKVFLKFKLQEIDLKINMKCLYSWFLLFVGSMKRPVIIWWSSVRIMRAVRSY